MAYVVVDEDGTHHRVIIDYRDKPTVKERALGWADVYAKINLNREATPAARYEAVLSIPPGFGVRVWNLPVTLLHCFENLLRCRFRPLPGIRGHMIDYLYQCLRREPLSVYRAAQPQPGYVFHASMLWEHDNCRQPTGFGKRLWKAVYKCPALLSKEDSWLESPIRITRPTKL